jgi:hypothetical protein
MQGWSLLREAIPAPSVAGRGMRDAPYARGRGPTDRPTEATL